MLSFSTLVLRDRGYRSWALTGGYRAWQEAGYPIDSKAAEVARRPDEVCPECDRPWRTTPPPADGRTSTEGHDADRRPKETEMDDVEIVHRISELADEEHRLERSHVGEGLSEEDRARLTSIEVALDQCWDLLRQRRARRGAGRDPDAALVRPEGVVEGYEQ